MIVMV
ncbi:hypothetical protein F383_24701 [Gossypium arboreum]